MIKNNQIEIYDEKIKEFIKQDDSQKVAMLGVKNDLEKLEKVLLKMYEDNIYNLTRFISDAGYMGWDYNTKKFQNMVKITNNIQEYFLKMYVLVEKGLGNELLIHQDEKQEGKIELPLYDGGTLIFELEDNKNDKRI